MKFKYNDQVTLLVDKEYANGDTITAGTKGTILIVYPFSVSYSVLFEGAKIPHRLAEDELS